MYKAEDEDWYRRNELTFSQLSKVYLMCDVMCDMNHVRRRR